MRKIAVFVFLVFVLAGCSLFQSKNTPTTVVDQQEAIDAAVKATIESLPQPTAMPTSMPTTQPTAEPTAMPTATNAPTATLQGATGQPTPQPGSHNPGTTTITFQGNPSEKTMGAWSLTYYGGATEEMKGWIFQDLAPKTWPEFPNVDNGEFKAAQGLEYGKTIDEYCQQQELCDVVVSAMHYRIISGDYNLPGVGDECVATSEYGCAIMIVNVGSVTASFEDQSVDAGWTLTGRYWDGKFLNQAIWAGLSHTSSNMLHLKSTLNPNPSVNAGANCGIPTGCPKVRATFIITSGNEVLVKGTMLVSR